MALLVQPGHQRWFLLVGVAAVGLFPLPAQSSAPGVCTASLNCSELVPGARLFNATLKRCLQRCRDDALGLCSRVAYGGPGGSDCALGVGLTGCDSSSWTLHSVAEASSSCGFGRGSVGSGGSCAPCPRGSASHADPGDLVGPWQLKDEGGNLLGRLEVARGGVASFPSGDRGQFVLWHSRADPNYPGAFFVDHLSNSSGGFPSSWDYAWLEDLPNPSIYNSSGGPRLVIRRFCGAGPLQCGSTSSGTSPEGSPYFIRTVFGFRESGRELPCQLLEGEGLAPLGEPTGLCCTGAGKGVSMNTQTSVGFTASFQVPSIGRWDYIRLINATWNNEPFNGLSGATLLVDPNDKEMCSGAGNFGSSGSGSTGPVVLFAMRGNCSFTQKALAAALVGASALIIANIDGSVAPDYLTIPDGSSVTPVIPAWMIEASVGSDLLAALTLGTGRTGVVERMGTPQISNDSSLQELCCVSTCRSRVVGAAAAGRVSLDVSQVCAQVTCAGLTASSSSPAAQMLLPRQQSTTAGGVCETCSAGLAAPQLGLAACGLCSGGQMASSDGSTCKPCPPGTAGDDGYCGFCKSPMAPDVLGRSCVQVSATTTAPLVVTTAALAQNVKLPCTQSPSPAPTWGLGSSPSSGGSSGSAATKTNTADEFPWGTVAAVVGSLVALCFGGGALRWWYQRLDSRGDLDGSPFGTVLRSIGVTKESASSDSAGQGANNGGDDEAPAAATEAEDDPAPAPKAKKK
ncbi:unnamed protein product, partial [Polarella glacialis]